MSRASLRIVETTPSGNDRFNARLAGNGLTPQLITSVLREADTGRMYRWADLLEEIRLADTHLAGELAKRELQVAGSPYEVRPGVGPRAKPAAEYCAELLATLDVPLASTALSFRDALTHLLGADYHGRAALEVVWARDGRALRPSQLHWIHPRRLAYEARDWTLHVYDAVSPDTAFAAFPGVPVDDPAVFPPGKLVVHTPRIMGAYPTREGLGRALVWQAAFKRWSVRDWLAFAEWAGRGLRVGKYASGKDPKNPAPASDEDVQVLQDALAAMSSTVSVVVPDITEIDVKGAPANGEVHERLVMLANNEMSKLVLGGTLSSDPGERGARSLGEVQERVRLMIAAGCAQAVAATIRRDLFAPAVRERFGDRAAVPLLAIVVEPAESLDAFVARAEKLAKLGMPLKAEQIRDRCGLETPQAGEETIGGAPYDPNAPPPAPPAAAPPPPAGDTAA